ncbi:sulfotransferase family protein [Rugosimonospora acidiphila]|uniref:Sulfotransferase family protein n=1 Tax=Rugosimonospora acidiphila TaxID=556531 RepID=A0ABP9SIQ0_9ACTN
MIHAVTLPRGVKTVRVIGVGFARTGTTSLKSALETLGMGPCYHMSEVIADGARVRQWLALAQGAPPRWDQIFDGYGSAVDWPVAAYWRALSEAYPQARLVLTVRDPERWYDSVRQTIFKQIIEPPRGPAALAFRLARAASPDLRAFFAMVQATMLQPIFSGRIADREHAIAVFERHIAEVRAAIPENRLLIYRVSEGWGPLCGFLDVPVPERPFPHDNDAGSFNRDHARNLARLTPLRPLVPQHAPGR